MRIRYYNVKGFHYLVGFSFRLFGVSGCRIIHHRSLQYITYYNSVSGLQNSGCGKNSDCGRDTRLKWTTLSASKIYNTYIFIIYGYNVIVHSSSPPPTTANVNFAQHKWSTFLACFFVLRTRLAVSIFTYNILDKYW